MVSWRKWMRSSTRPGIETCGSLSARPYRPAGSHPLDYPRQPGGRSGASRQRCPGGTTSGRPSGKRRDQTGACRSTGPLSCADRLPLCRRLRCRATPSLDPQSPSWRPGPVGPSSGHLRFMASISPASAACSSSEITASSNPRARAVLSAAVMSMPSTRHEGAMVLTQGARTVGHRSTRCAAVPRRLLPPYAPAPVKARTR